MAILKIFLFLSIIWVIYLFSLWFWGKERRDKLFEDEEDEDDEDESEESSIELEEYTLNGSDSDEESKDQELNNARRFRIRRRGNANNSYC